VLFVPCEVELKLSKLFVWFSSSLKEVSFVKASEPSVTLCVGAADGT